MVEDVSSWLSGVPSEEMIGQAAVLAKELNVFAIVRDGARLLSVSTSGALEELRQNRDVEVLFRQGPYWTPEIGKAVAGAEGRQSKAAAEAKRAVPLFAAARTGDIKRMREVLSAGVDVNTRNKVGETALFEAARARQIAAAEFLLSQGADTGVQCHCFRNVLSHVEHDPAMERLLRAHGAKRRALGGWDAIADEAPQTGACAELPPAFEKRSSHAAEDSRGSAGAGAVRVGMSVEELVARVGRPHSKSSMGDVLSSLAGVIVIGSPDMSMELWNYGSFKVFLSGGVVSSVE